MGSDTTQCKRPKTDGEKKKIISGNSGKTQAPLFSATRVVVD